MPLTAQTPRIVPAMTAPLDARLAFLRRTYMTLAGSVAAFAVLTAMLVQSGVGETLAQTLGSRWLFAIGGLMVIAWIANSMARPGNSLGTQLAGLALYIVGEALIFSPMLWIAATQIEGPVIGPAAAITAIVFGGLSFYVLTTRKDFSFLRGMLVVAMWVALGVIVLSFVFGVGLGTWFSAAMVLLACGAILYDTSKILHHYPTTEHVGAALSLFASVMLLFWYVLRLVMAARD